MKKPHAEGNGEAGCQGVIAVGGTDVVGDVSELLVRVLTEAVKDPDSAPVVELVDLVAGQSGGGQVGLQLFLYEVTEDPSARNRGPRQTLVEDPVTGAVHQETRRADMALLLRYLLIPVGGGPAAQQHVLGRAMRALYDDAILRAAGMSFQAGESLKLRLAPLTLDERAKVWWAISQPYRLSLNYEVRVVNLASRDMSAGAPVSEAAVGLGAAGAES
ncbi:DUF4255 domain-containing protein [Streptomyces chartreusis]|uniref:DUF4255 domain-containing protein n=1 Tax=Streptomyces chartreusis TaxID=1969 RepID=UPI0021006B42|nr:DUF4255 domain-containing protein [Streptomyces chartreusis]